MMKTWSIVFNPPLSVLGATLVDEALNVTFATRVGQAKNSYVRMHFLSTETTWEIKQENYYRCGFVSQKEVKASVGT